jgi:hypothetical protein
MNSHLPKRKQATQDNPTKENKSIANMRRGNIPMKAIRGRVNHSINLRILDRIMKNESTFINQLSTIEFEGLYTDRMIFKFE